MDEKNKTVYDDLNILILEYLNFMKCEKTREGFVNELNELNIPIVDIKDENKSNFNSFCKTLIDYFEKGKKIEFFKMWEKNLPEKLKMDDIVCQKLEFYCQVYFAIYPIFKNDEINVSLMTEFRDFLETKGAKLSKSSEFVQFYALPYITNPKEHPSFTELFQDNWISGLKLRLSKFINIVLDNKKEPLLLKFYDKNYKISDHDSTYKQLQTKVVQSEKRTQHYIKRLNQVQVDYHSLIGLTAELVDLLEGSLQGNPVNPTHLQQVCQRLLISQKHRLATTNFPNNESYNFNFDISRPGTASKLLRQSVKTPIKIENFTNKQKENSKYLSKKSDLDFKQIKEDILQGNDRLKALIFQALRWRITKTTIDIRNEVVKNIIKFDLFGMNSNNYQELIIAITNGTIGENQTRENLFRLLNAMATLSKGRSYMTSDLVLCNALLSNIKIIANESILRENLIGALQKLSLRRTIQTFMIKSGMIEWLLDLLENHENLSDYSLDYSVALLMNLCLRNSGKKECVKHKSRILEILIKMLGTFNNDIISYVNGALYSILSISEIRLEAKNMDLESKLRVYMSSANIDITRQLEYIIQQLNTDESPKLEESDDEEEDDEEDPDIMELELDKEESLHPLEDELSGEDLLDKYCDKKNGTNGENFESNESIVFTNRPITPGTSNKRSSIVSQRSNSQLNNSNTVENTKRTFSPNNQKSSDYQDVFAEKPKLPRTPYQDSIIDSNRSLDRTKPNSGNIKNKQTSAR